MRPSDKPLVVMSCLEVLLKVIEVNDLQVSKIIAAESGWRHSILQI